MSFMSIKAWSCSVLLSILGITVASSAVVADTEPYRSKQTDKNTMILAQTIYEQARQELPEDWYAVYRIIDRIARANQLDERPWRVVLVQEYDINAFATEVNLIALYSGLMDQLAGDSSAIACVIGHEMAHHVSRHIAASEAERVRLTAEIQDQARQEIEAEIEDAQGDARDSRIGAGVLDAFGIGIGSGILRNNARKREAEANQRIQEIIDLKQAELEARLLEQNRTNEFEADQLGYTYVARAGFEPEGCFRTMEVLARTQGAEFDTTHPAVPKRIEALETLLKENPPEELELQGNSRISASQPLTYDLSEDKVSLRINSVRGGSAADDLERLFGQ